jgi:enediyne biosynthesis protein E4
MPILLRKLLYGLFFLLTSTFCGCTDKSDTTADAPTEPPMFTLLPAEKTGIGFQNELTEGLNTNILLYEYFYNGGGVATGDFNGDGRIDAYFTANLTDNKLYLNQTTPGQKDWKFQDVTDQSGAGGRPGPWKTGVTTVDINADGRLDLYLCYSGAMPPEKRRNQLFINQGNDANGVPMFADEAANYGLDSPGFSNQAYFLDYDRDGDLDMLLLNHNPKNLPILNEASTAQLLATDDPERGLRLFRQTDRGHFDDVTQQSGINGSALSYGLGLGLADFNDDGWLDFYVSNDYAVPDYLYINQKNGKFSNDIQQSLGHTSQFSMGNDVADVDNDGRADIFTLDMLPEDNHRQKLLLAPDNFAKFELNVRSGFYYQYMRNMLHLNQGNSTFSEVGQLAGVSSTDWSWAALLADFDNDGWKDLFVSNGYKRDYTNLDFIKYMDDFIKSKGRLQREDVLTIIGQMPASNVVNYVFRNQQGAGFADQTKNWGLNTPSNSNGAAYADLDNDGDLDLLVNNINQPAFVYRNDSPKSTSNNYLQIKLMGEGGNSQGIGTAVTLFANGQQQTQMQTIARGYLSAVSPVLHFGLGKAAKLDSVVVVWPTGKRQTLPGIAANQTLTLTESNAQRQPVRTLTTRPLFAEIPSPIAWQSARQPVNDFDRQALLINELSHSGPCMTTGDVNADGRDDVFVGGTAGQSGGLFLQSANGSFQRKITPALDADRACHDAAAAIFDANGDGFPDLYVASGGYHDLTPTDARLQDRLYLNDGRGNFTKNVRALPPLLGSKSCVAVADINRDGHPDLFVGGRVVPGRYPETPASYVLLNDGRGNFSDQTAQRAPELSRIGLVTDAVWADLDGDKQPELVVVGEWMPVSVFGEQNGKLVNKTIRFLGKNYAGWWNKLAVGDFNGDKKPDLMIGNWGQNSQIKASPAEPTELYYADFDQNGSVEPILCCYVQGKSYPYLTRDELLTQINGYRPRYPTYASYADARLPDVFDGNALAKSKRLSATHLQTSCLLSSPTGKYSLTQLPVQAQYAPVHTITVLDYDRDGRQDVLLCGNESHSKIRLGKSDANYGVLLQGNGAGGFRYVPQHESGFVLHGDVRSVTWLNNQLLFGINGDKLLTYKQL